MYLVISLLVSLLLAIPTYGLSLVVLFLIKSWFDKQAVRAILNKALISLKDGSEEAEVLYHINRRAVTRTFDLFAIDERSEEKVNNDNVITSYTALIQHPMVKSPIFLNVIYTSKATLVKAESM